jgi:hypothetical protein
MLFRFVEGLSSSSYLDGVIQLRQSHILALAQISVKLTDCPSRAPNMDQTDNMWSELKKT